MTKTITTIERELKPILEQIQNRPVLFGNDRVSQPRIPSLVMRYLMFVKVGRPYMYYFDATVDLDEVLVTPSEITFSMLMIGGNARGDMISLIGSFWNETVNNLLSDIGIAYLRDTEITDLTEDIGGDMEQRAQSDITFSCNMVVDNGIILTIEEIGITPIIINPGGDIISLKEIIIKK